MRLLVVGANGMLAHDVLRAGERAGHDLVGVDLPEVDITVPEQVDELVERVQSWTASSTARPGPTSTARRATRTRRGR